MARQSLSGPFDWWLLGWQTAIMLAEAQAVIAMRIMGMAGVWAVTPSETARMVSEKGVAWSSAMTAVRSAAMAGKPPHKIAGAALAPVRRRTRANSRRLARRGPVRPARR